MTPEKVRGRLLPLLESQRQAVPDVQAQRLEHCLVVVAIEEPHWNGDVPELAEGSEPMDTVNDTHRAPLDQQRGPHVNRLSERGDMFRVEAARPRPVPDVDVVERNVRRRRHGALPVLRPTAPSVDIPNGVIPNCDHRITP